MSSCQITGNSKGMTFLLPFNKYVSPVLFSVYYLKTKIVLARLIFDGFIMLLHGCKFSPDIDKTVLVISTSACLFDTILKDKRSEKKIIRTCHLCHMIYRKICG